MEKPDPQLSAEELDGEQAADLPRRDAMSLVDPGVLMTQFKVAPPLPPDAPTPMPPQPAT
jgi:hypothetical protein